MAICPIIVHFSTKRARSMHDVAWRGMWICVRSKDAQKQLARTSLTRGNKGTRLVSIKLGMTFPFPFSLTGRVGAGVSTLATENRNGVSLSFAFFSVWLLPTDAPSAESALVRRVDGCFTSLFALPSLKNLNCASVLLGKCSTVSFQPQNAGRNSTALD